MAMRVQARALVAGEASGVLLKLHAPLSFWGGVDAATGEIVDRQSDGYGKSIAGCVLALAALRGSSSSSAVLLELVHVKKAPAAIIIAEADAILIAGVLAAREMGWRYPPLLQLSAGEQAMLPEGTIDVHNDGTLNYQPSRFATTP